MPCGECDDDNDGCGCAIVNGWEGMCWRLLEVNNHDHNKNTLGL